ncbi:hypothetical protein BJ165DRAFT_1608608 [Panaeolus papilionaceus]|nr:hypothetical protein BJ165DRAFT_1608608 [Panaeolus papilionaceus]
MSDYQSQPYYFDNKFSGFFLHTTSPFLVTDTLLSDRSDSDTDMLNSNLDGWESTYWEGIPTTTPLYPCPVPESCESLRQEDKNLEQLIGATFSHPDQDKVPSIVPESRAIERAASSNLVLSSVSYKNPFSDRRSAMEPRSVLERRASDARFVEASWQIIEIMSSVRFYPNQGNTETNPAIDRATQQLDAYIYSLSEDVSSWITTQRRPRVGVSSAKRHAVARRKHVEKNGLHLCLWCKDTITARLNLANHVRAHLNLHLSSTQMPQVGCAGGGALDLVTLVSLGNAVFATFATIGETGLARFPNVKLNTHLLARGA